MYKPCRSLLFICALLENSEPQKRGFSPLFVLGISLNEDSALSEGKDDIRRVLVNMSLDFADKLALARRYVAGRKPVQRIGYNVRPAWLAVAAADVG